MKHGKDFMADKPGMTTLEQLAEARQGPGGDGPHLLRPVQRAPGEPRHGEGGRPGQGGRHRQGDPDDRPRAASHDPKTRPAWFFEKERYGGILTDIASHQFDQFLFFTGSTRAEVVASQVGNVAHPQWPGLEDFGDAMVRGNGGSGYVRVDWFTPDGLSTWGDGRLTILGTEGFIEIRKNVDIAGRPGGNHLFLVDQKETRYIDCKDVPLPYGERLVDDVLEPHRDGHAPGPLLPGHGAGAARGEAGAAGGFEDDLRRRRAGRPGPSARGGRLLAAAHRSLRCARQLDFEHVGDEHLAPVLVEVDGGALRVAAHGHPGAELLVAEPLPDGQGLVHGLLLFCGAA